MKKIISIFAIAGLGLMASCSMSDMRAKEAALDAQQRTIDSLKMEMVKQHVIDSMNEMMASRYVIPQIITPLSEQTTQTARKATTRKRTAPKARTTRRTTGTYSEPVAQSQPAPVYTEPAQTPVYNETPPATTEKKGWSAKAKGAVIGAGTGAVAGAVINKRNRVAGAVIGGVLGAGAGTGIGAIIDKKNGR